MYDLNHIVESKIHEEKEVLFKQSQEQGASEGAYLDFVCEF